MPNVKITVLKTSTEEDIFEKYAHDDCEKTCPIHDEGEEYTVNPGDFQVPKGFCPSAWDSISSLVQTLMHGGDFGEWKWMENKETAVGCCHDGLRPVFFKIEPVE